MVFGLAKKIFSKSAAGFRHMKTGDFIVLGNILREPAEK